MTVHEVDAAEPTAAAQTAPPEAYPQAYGDETVVDYPLTGAAPIPDRRYGRTRWMLSLAALLAAGAAFIATGAYGARVLTAPPPAPVVITSTLTVPAPDPNAAFLADLDRAGIPHANQDDIAVGDAYVMCMGLRNGLPWPEIEDTAANGMHIPRPLVARFIDLAHRHYCPAVVIK